jgi:hypothetical protein
MLSVELKKPPLRWLFGSLGVAVFYLYFQRSKLNGVIWQVFAADSRIGRYLGMRRSDGARGARGGQQQLAADVGAFRHLERELVVRCGDYRTAATADGAAGAVQVADMLEGESGGESEGCGVTKQN